MVKCGDNTQHSNKLTQTSRLARLSYSMVIYIIFLENDNASDR